MTIQVTGRSGSKGTVRVSEIAGLFEIPANDKFAPEDANYTMLIFKSGTQMDVFDNYDELSKTYLEALANEFK